MGRMTLDELAEEYFGAARLQSRAIERNREKLALAKSGRNAAEYLRLKKLLCMLYLQRREILEIARYLKDYYKFSSPALLKGGVA